MELRAFDARIIIGQSEADRTHEASDTQHDRVDISHRASPSIRFLPFAIPLRVDQSVVHGVPAPQAIRRQFGAGPPAMDRIVPAEILAAGQNGLTKGRE
jgi:hypothetical protein